MKTSELIRLLQEADPTGERECCIGSEDIFFVDVEPGYYDGCHTVLKLDPLNEYYNVIGVEIRGDDEKVKIHTLGWKDAIANIDTVPVEFDGKYARDHYAEEVEAWRATVRSWAHRQKDATTPSSGH